MRLLSFAFIFAIGGLSLATFATSETLHHSADIPEIAPLTTEVASID